MKIDVWSFSESFSREVKESKYIDMSDRELTFVEKCLNICSIFPVFDYDINYSDLLKYDTIISISDIFTKPRYKRYQDMVLPTSVFGDSFLTAGIFLDIPTLFVGTRDVDTIEKYGKYRFKFPYYIISHRDSIMGVLTEINLKKDAEVFLVAVDKHHHDTKHTNIVLKQVEKELKLYAREID